MANTKKYISLDKLTKYHEKEVIRVNGLINTAKEESNAYADSLATNYDAAGAAATEAGKVQTKLDEEILRAKGREDEIAGLVGTAQKEVDALELVVDTKANASDLTALANKVGEVPADQTVMGIIENIQENAYNDTELRNLITGLTNNKADKTQVATDIENAVKTETDARVEAVKAVQDALDTLAETHATDKDALEDAIELKADATTVDELANTAATKTALEEEVTRAKAREDEIAGLVTAEAQRAAGVEADHEERLVEVETFFKTAEGETIDQALDTLVEIQKYVTGEGEVADQMLLDIAANKKAIEDHAALDHDFATADATLKAELEGKINAKADKTTVEGIDGRLTTAEGKITTVEGKVTTLEGEMDAVQGAVATKAEKTYVDDADKALSDRIETLEGKFTEGEGSVEDMIADAINEEATRIDGLLDKKVDKVDGKGLSTNDLTNELKANYDAAYAHSQAAHAPSNAQANVIETVKVNGTVVTVTDKAVDIAVPTDNSQLANGAGYLVASDVANKADKATTLAGYGIADAYTSAQTDTAIANAMEQFVEASEEDINGLF